MDNHNWLWRLWMSFLHPGICWKHMHEKTGSWGGMFCGICEYETRDNERLKYQALCKRHDITPNL